MEAKAVKQMIDGWFYDHRPELYPDNEFIDNIYEEVKDDVAGLDREAGYIVLSEYLRMNYSNVAYDIILEVLEEDEFEEYRDKLNGTIPFIAHGEHESIVKEVTKERIIEKYGSTLAELLDNQSLYEEIRNILRRRDKEWKVND